MYSHGCLTASTYTKDLRLLIFKFCSADRKAKGTLFQTQPPHHLKGHLLCLNGRHVPHPARRIKNAPPACQKWIYFPPSNMDEPYGTWRKVYVALENSAPPFLWKDLWGFIIQTV